MCHSTFRPVRAARVNGDRFRGIDVGIACRRRHSGLGSVVRSTVFFCRRNPTGSTRHILELARPVAVWAIGRAVDRYL